MKLAVRTTEIKVYTWRANMHCQGIACTWSFGMGLTSAEGQKLECLKRTATNFYWYSENLVSPSFSKAVLVFYITQAFSILNTNRLLDPLYTQWSQLMFIPNQSLFCWLSTHPTYLWNRWIPRTTRPIKKNSIVKILVESQKSKNLKVVLDQVFKSKLGRGSSYWRVSACNTHSIF